MLTREVPMEFLRWIGFVCGMWSLCILCGAARAADLGITFGEVEQVVQAEFPQEEFEMRKQPGSIAYTLGSGIRFGVVTATTQAGTSIEKSTPVNNLVFGVTAQFCVSTRAEQLDDPCYESDEYRKTLYERFDAIASAIWRKIGNRISFAEWRSKAQQEGLERRYGMRAYAERIDGVWAVAVVGTGSLAHRGTFLLWSNPECPFDELLNDPESMRERYPRLAKHGVCPSDMGFPR